MVNEKRLTDANVLINEVDNSRHNNSHTIGRVRLNHITEHNHFLRMILDAPTVDAVEVVHGRWLPDMEEFDDDPSVGIRGGVFQTGWKCSICGRSEQAKEPYCNCGAKMDGDGNGI